MSQPPLVTISASYGAGGSRVAPLLAERLDVAFLERVMPRDVAAGLAVPLAEARRQQHHPGRSLGRLLRQLPAERGSPEPGVAAADEVDADAAYRRSSGAELRYRADEGAVVLGRAGAVVLRDIPHALHVRLSGPRELRIEQAMVLEEIEPRHGALAAGAGRPRPRHVRPALLRRRPRRRGAVPRGAGLHTARARRLRGGHRRRRARARRLNAGVRSAPSPHASSDRPTISFMISLDPA